MRGLIGPDPTTMGLEVCSEVRASVRAEERAKRNEREKRRGWRGRKRSEPEKRPPNRSHMLADEGALQWRERASKGAGGGASERARRRWRCYCCCWRCSSAARAGNRRGLASDASETHRTDTAAGEVAQARR
jgi:hypothetical protein